MKFWQKAFICVIVVYLLGFDVIGYILADRSYTLNRDYALESAEAEHEVIKKSLTESLRLSGDLFSEINHANLSVTMSPYADFYREQGIYFVLYQDEVLAYSNAPFEPITERYAFQRDRRVVEMKTAEGRLYCFISSYLSEPNANLRYVYVKDMHSLAEFKSIVIKTFTMVGVTIGLMLAVIMLVLLIGLTSPFRRLNELASEISAGNYEKRADIKSRDEIGDFANSFNLMIDRIRGHIATLSRMTESKQFFIDNLAHEIRTPVTAIIGYGELLKYADCSEDERETSIDHIIRQGRRIQRMSLKLLDLAYMENESAQIAPVLIESVFEDAVISLNNRLRDKAIDLRMEIAPISVNGDAELLESLLVNLLDNAVSASDVGGIIKIRAGVESDGASIEITDYGKGMSKEEIARIVEPFYRVDKARSGSNAGLGLALCARICEIHNAALNFISESGHGTTVKILFTTR